MKNFLDVHSKQSNSFVATAFGIAVTFLLFGGYEATHVATEHAILSLTAPVLHAVQADAVARMDPIVVTAKRG